MGSEDDCQKRLKSHKNGHIKYVNKCLKNKECLKNDSDVSWWGIEECNWIYWHAILWCE